LIFDEVMTGFRLAFGGAQELYNVKADIVTYGKVIGGGMPVGAFAARNEIMNKLSPRGDVSSGNFKRKSSRNESWTYHASTHQKQS
jgi:glutamate-1-semialdehyde aminotransferase